jgi:hypothetical protein
VEWEWVHLVCRPMNDLVYHQWMLEECGAFDGKGDGRATRSTRKIPVPVPHCPQQIQPDMTGARTRTTNVAILRLTARAVAETIAALSVSNRAISNDLRELKLVQFLNGYKRKPEATWKQWCCPSHEAVKAYWGEQVQLNYSWPRHQKDWVVSFTHPPHYSLGKGPRYP